MAIHYRDLPEALYADIQDLAEMWDVGRTAIPSIIARAHQLLGPRVPGLLDPIIVRYTEAGYPRTRLWAAVDVAFWEKMRPRSEGRWPRSRQQWRRVLGLEPNEAASN